MILEGWSTQRQTSLAKETYLEIPEYRRHHNVPADSGPAENELGAIGFALLDILHHPFVLKPGHLRAVRRGLIERIAHDAGFGGVFNELLNEGLIHLLVNQDPRRGTANLTGVAHDAYMCPFYGLFEIRVLERVRHGKAVQARLDAYFKDQQRRLPARLNGAFGLQSARQSTRPGGAHMFLRFTAAAFITARPVAVEPVNAILSMSGCDEIAAPAVWIECCLSYRKKEKEKQNPGFSPSRNPRGC